MGEYLSMHPECCGRMDPIASKPTRTRTEEDSVKRALVAFAPIALVASLLTACSGGGATAGVDGAECAPEGDVSKSIELTGDFGAADLALDTKTPVTADALERSVLIEGDGDAVTTGDSVNAQFTIFNGTSGDVLSSEASTLVMNKEQLQPWALNVMGCATVGDRVAAVSPVSDILGEGNAGSYGLNDDDSLVLVFDVLETGPAPAEPGTLEPDELLKKAEGEPQDPVEGLPTVVLAEDGSPTITMPEGVDAPDTLTVETLIKGDGEEVQAGDRVYVHYRGVIWRTGEEFDSSWSRGEPTAFTTDGVIGGFEQALVGQTVGSQVISVVPAEDGGYGAAQLQQMGHEPDDVMVFVLDILGTVHAE